jgi:hypothetical protein
MARTGRPPWTPPNLAEIEGMAARGMTFDAIAKTLGIAAWTLIRKRRQMRELSEAIDRGRSKGHMMIANRLFEAAIGGDVNAMKFYLERKAGWTETVGVEVSQIDAIKKQQDSQLQFLRAMTPEERKIVREITERARERLRARNQPKAIETTATPA